MKDLVEKGLVTTLGSWLLIHEVADDFIREMIAKGKAEASDKRRMLEELSVRVDEEKEEIRKRIGQMLSQVMNEAGAVTPGDLEKVEKRLADLERRLKVLEKGS